MKCRPMAKNAVTDDALENWIVNWQKKNFNVDESCKQLALVTIAVCLLSLSEANSAPGAADPQRFLLGKTDL